MVSTQKNQKNILLLIQCDRVKGGGWSNSYTSVWVYNAGARSLHLSRVLLLFFLPSFLLLIFIPDASWYSYSLFSNKDYKPNVCFCAFVFCWVTTLERKIQFMISARVGKTCNWAYFVKYNFTLHYLFVKFLELLHTWNVSNSIDAIKIISVKDKN